MKTNKSSYYSLWIMSLGKVLIFMYYKYYRYHI